MAVDETQAPLEVSWDDPSIKLPPNTNALKIDRFKGTLNKTDRLLILDHNPVMIYQHYKKGFGYVRCLKTLPDPQRCAACDSGDKPLQKFNVNVLEYPEGVAGPDLSATNVRILLWSFGIKVFNDLKGIKAEWGELTNYDVRVTCTNSEYQHLSVTNCRERLFDSSPKSKEIEEFIDLNKFNLKHRLNKSLTEEQLLGVWTGKLKSEDIFKKRGTEPPPSMLQSAPTADAYAMAVEVPGEKVPAPKKIDLTKLL